MKGLARIAQAPIAFHPLNRIVSVVHCLTGDGQDDRSILLVNLKDVFQKPVSVHIESSHARLVVLERYPLGNVPTTRFVSRTCPRGRQCSRASF